MPSKDELTSVQQKLLEFVHDFSERHGMAPSHREIAAELGFSGVRAATYQLDRLGDKGFVDRERRKARGVRLTDKGKQAAGFQPIPIVGGIPAGVPVIAEEMYEGLLHIRRELGQSGDFALRVDGDSMNGAGIFHGDYVLVRKQDYAEHGSVVVALISGFESEGALKAFFLRDHEVVFAPANPDYQPIILPRDSDDWRILGVVAAVVRVGSIRVQMPHILRKPAQ